VAGRQALAATRSAAEVATSRGDAEGGAVRHVLGGRRAHELVSCTGAALPRRRRTDQQKQTVSIRQSETNGVFTTVYILFYVRPIYLSIFIRPIKDNLNAIGHAVGQDSEQSG